MLSTPTPDYEDKNASDFSQSDVLSRPTSEVENPDYLRAALKISIACPSQTPSLTEPEQAVISPKKQFSVWRCTAEACA